MPQEVAPKHPGRSCRAHRALPLAHLPHDGGHCPRARLGPQPVLSQAQAHICSRGGMQWSLGAGSNLCYPGVRQ